MPVVTAAPYDLDDEPIGIGGYGMVFRGRHRRDGHMAAVKIAHPGRLSLARLRREMKVQGTLNHPNVMPIILSNVRAGWLSMPIAKDTLPKFRTSGGVSEESLVSILTAVARGLQHAHYNGHIHRDVTPSNILRVVDGRGDRWVVSDWGLVQMADPQTALPLTMTGEALGTQAFAPPELRGRAHGVGPESDVYYLGAVAAWALTGEQPSHRYMPKPSSGIWSHFVNVTTQRDPTLRPRSMVDVLSLLYDMSVVYRSTFVSDICDNCTEPVGGVRCDYCGYPNVGYN